MQIKAKMMNLRALKFVITLCTITFVTLGLSACGFARIPDLFRLNKECQEEGYYMAEFEFKMLGFAYLLDKGHYLEANRGVEKLYTQLKNREGLIKVPKFADKNQEMDFYLNLQNPRTGAFMNDSFPYCTFEGPTGNELIHLESLAKETGRPLRLKYPLKFLDEINTPESLHRYLDEMANIGWLATKLPESTFHIVRDLISYSEADNIVERNHLYQFSPEWKKSLLQWFYENQDPETGYWGPRSRSNGKLTKVDLHNTGSIIKGFVNREGEDRYPEFPLRYRDKMIKTTLRILKEKPPEDDAEDLDEWHGWILRQGKGVSMLTRYLWKNAASGEKAEAREIFESFLRLKFDKFYHPSEGAFAYYPAARHASLDGTGTVIGNLGDLGYFSAKNQKRVWGNPETSWTDLGLRNVIELTDKDLNSLRSNKKINSVRFYATPPDSGHFTQAVAGIFYLNAHPVPDVLEIAPKLKTWADTLTQTMGNWISKQDVLTDLSEFSPETPPLFKNRIPLREMNRALQEKGGLTLIGFDIFQVPVCRITYRQK